MTFPIATVAEVWAQMDGQPGSNTPPAYLGELCEAAAEIIAGQTKRDFYATPDRRSTGLTVPSGGLATDAPSIAIDDADRVGEVWAIGSESLYVRAHSGGALQLDRGQLDTDAAAHAADAVITRMVAPADVRQAAIALAVRWSRGTRAGWSTSELGMDGNAVQFSDRMPSDLDRVLRRHRRVILP